MPRNVVFFVHGIGQQAAGWSRAPGGPVAALESAMALYPACFAAGKPLADYLDLVEVRYDDIFDRVLDGWQELGRSLPANAGFGWVAAARDLLQSVNGKKDLFLRYGGDVLLYCGFDLVARAVRLRVNSVVATKVYQAYLAARGTPGQLPRFAVVAHSLGTTVAQDALYQLAQAKWDDDVVEVAAKRPDLEANPNLSAAERSDYEAVVAGARANPDRPVPVGLDALFLVSNTYPLLRQVPGEYALLKTAAGDYDCAGVYNINHALDPVSRIGGGSANPNPRPDWSNVTVAHIHDANIHGYAHYLSNPAVHGLLFWRLIDPGFSTACYASAQSRAQSPEWQGFGGPLAGLEAQAKTRLENELRALVAGQRSVGALCAAIEALAKRVEAG
jgi:hypothetical protein